MYFSVVLLFATTNPTLSALLTFRKIVPQMKASYTDFLRMAIDLGPKLVGVPKVGTIPWLVAFSGVNETIFRLFAYVSTTTGL